MDSPKLPPLDMHAHIAVDVTMGQVRRLGGAVVLAVTRNLTEAASIPFGCYPHLVWGLGVHPQSRDALAGYSGEAFTAMLPRFALIGEVGLDGRSGNLHAQRTVFEDVLQRSHGQPVIVSIHSSGAIEAVLSLLARHTVRAPILHWFGGSVEQIRRAVDLGSYFSVNAAMKDETLAAMPPTRIVTETDFPYTRRVGALRPGGTEPIEKRLAVLWSCDVGTVRRQLWQTFRAMVERCGASPRLPMQVRTLFAALDTTSETMRSSLQSGTPWDRTVDEFHPLD